MAAKAWLSKISQQPVIAVIRHAEPAIALNMAYAVVQGGIRNLEITWTCAQAPELIQQLRQELPHCSIGTGTIVNAEQMEKAIAAGAEFIFSPHTNPALIQQAVEAAIAVIPGAFTPTEILTAWQAGATAVKVFPISSAGGCQYLHNIRSVLPDIPLIPTGGVTIQNAKAFLDAGAIAIGLSGELFPRSALQQRNWAEITRLAQSLQTHLARSV